MKDLPWFYSFSYLDFVFYRSADMGKRTSFLSVPKAEFPHDVVKQIDLSRLENMFWMTKSLEPIFLKDLAWFYSFSNLDFDFYRASDMGKRISFLSVPVADISLDFVEQIDLNRLEKL